jgi:ribose transport system substrate-binding protein
VIESDRTAGSAVSRRQFLSRLIAVAVAVPATTALLQACSSAPAAPAAPAATTASAAPPTSAPAAPPTSAPAAPATSAPAAQPTTAAAPATTAGPAVADGSKSLRDIGDKPPLKIEMSPESDLRDADKQQAQVMVDGAKYKKNPPYVIGFTDASVSNSWAVLSRATLEWEVARWGPDVIKDYKLTDAQDKDEKQIADIEDLLSQGIDGLLVRPATAAATNAVVSRAFEQGIPVVVYDRKLTTPNITCFVECNNYSIGRKTSQALIKALNGKGKIVALSGIAGAGPAIDRFTALEDLLKENPGLELLDQQFADWSPSKGKTIMQAMIQAHPQIDGIWTDSGLQGSGAIEAMQEAGRPLVPTVGDDYNGFLKQAKTLGFPFAGIANPQWQSAVGLDYLVRILMGESVPSYVSMRGAEIHAENLDQFVRTDLPDDYWGDVILPPDELKKVLKI